MTRETEFGDLLKALDKEDVQDRAVEAHEGSFFSGAPDDATIVARAREFDDLHKHWVRRDLWLKTAKRIGKTKGTGLRVLTLPGQHLFEVKLYAQEGLLASHGDGAEAKLSVVGFETDPAVFGLLATSEPKLLELLYGDILEALTEPESANGKTLRLHAPYDVINLDLTANIATSSDGPYSPFLRGIHECFQIQGSQTGRWALMVTFRVGMLETEPTVVHELEGLFQKNLSTHLLVKEACLARYKVKTAKEVLAHDPEEGLGQFTGKWVIEQGHSFEWGCMFFRHATYDRQYSKDGTEHRYSIRKLVFEFTRRPTGSTELVVSSIPPQSWHADDLARLFDAAALMNVDTAVANITGPYREKLEREIEEMRG
jgi:hypothetical protein